MNANASAVVMLMRSAVSEAWSAWWDHVTEADRADGYDAVERQLWAAFEEAAEVFHLEVEARPALGAA